MFVPGQNQHVAYQTLLYILLIYFPPPKNWQFVVLSILQIVCLCAWECLDSQELRWNKVQPTTGREGWEASQHTHLEHKTNNSFHNKHFYLEGSPLCIFIFLLVPVKDLQSQKRSKSAATEAPLSCWNTSLVVPPSNLWLCTSQYMTESHLHIARWIFWHVRIDLAQVLWCC